MKIEGFLFNILKNPFLRINIFDKRNIKVRLYFNVIKQKYKF